MDDKLDAAAVSTHPTSPMNTARRMSGTAQDGPLSAGDNMASNQLEQMGYQQEMKRSLGMLSTLGLAFAIMAGAHPLSRGLERRSSQDTNCCTLCDTKRWGVSLTTLNIALTDGGPVTILYGVRLSPCITGQIAKR
jgi:hypothetical protein